MNDNYLEEMQLLEVKAGAIVPHLTRCTDMLSWGYYRQVEHDQNGRADFHYLCGSGGLLLRLEWGRMNETIQVTAWGYPKYPYNDSMFRDECYKISIPAKLGPLQMALEIHEKLLPEYRKRFNWIATSIDRLKAAEQAVDRLINAIKNIPGVRIRDERNRPQYNSPDVEISVAGTDIVVCPTASGVRVKAGRFQNWNIETLPAIIATLAKSPEEEHADMTPLDTQSDSPALNGTSGRVPEPEHGMQSRPMHFDCGNWEITINS